MVRRILAWDPPLWVVALCLFGPALTIPYLIDGALSLPTLTIAAVCFGAQIGRRRRLGATRTRAG